MRARSVIRRVTLADPSLPLPLSQGRRAPSRRVRKRSNGGISAALAEGAGKTRMRDVQR